MSLMRVEVVSEPFIPESKNKKVPEKQKFSCLQDKHQEWDEKGKITQQESGGASEQSCWPDSHRAEGHGVTWMPS